MSNMDKGKEQNYNKTKYVTYKPKIDDLNKYKTDLANLARRSTKAPDPMKDAKNLIYYRE